MKRRGKGARNIGPDTTVGIASSRALSSGEDANASAAPHRTSCRYIFQPRHGRRHKLLKSDGPILRRKIDRPPPTPIRPLFSLSSAWPVSPVFLSPARHYACENTRTTNDDNIFEPGPALADWLEFSFNLSRVVAPGDKWRDERNWTVRCTARTRSPKM